MSSLKPVSAVDGESGVRARELTRLARCRDGGDGGAIAAAVMFTTVLAELDRTARRQQRTLPTAREREALEKAFWERLIPTLAAVDADLARSDLTSTRRGVQAVLNPWMLRSRLWARSWLKPHGFPGDYRMLEWMYDLEYDSCAHNDQPAAVNLLDGLFRSVHSVRAVWHRRTWFAELIARHSREGQTVRVLDIASGGSRYVNDVIRSRGPRVVEPVFFDQDPAALAFVRSWLPADAPGRTVCAPVSRIRDTLPLHTRARRAQFDVVISTGLFDYLPTEFARELLEHMCRLTRRGGTVAICNFSPQDASRVVKDWVADWQLTYRTGRELEALFPPGLTPQLSRSSDGGLLYAYAEIDATTGTTRRGAS